MVASLTNEEQQSYSGVWEEVQNRSLIEFENDVMVAMQKYFKTNLLLDHMQSGYIKTPYTTESASAYFKGVAIELLGSNYTTIFINHVELYLNAAGNGSIYVYDYNSGRLLDTISYTGSIGSNLIEVNKTYTVYGQRSKLFVCYNATAVSSVETTVYAPMDNSRGVSITRGARVSTASSIIDSNMEFTGNTGGLTVNYNVQCSVDRFICGVRNLFKTALWYKHGEQLMAERSHTTRINQFTLINKERADELRADFQKKYMAAMETVLNNLEPSSDGLCIECEKERTYKYSLP